jgi:hypothetical protein
MPPPPEGTYLCTEVLQLGTTYLTLWYVYADSLLNITRILGAASVGTAGRPMVFASL